jgi:hypothetical protein
MKIVFIVLAVLVAQVGLGQQVEVSGGVFPPCVFTDSGLEGTGVYCHADVSLKGRAMDQALYLRVGRSVLYASATNAEHIGVSEEMYLNSLVVGTNVMRWLGVEDLNLDLGIGRYYGSKTMIRIRQDVQGNVISRNTDRQQSSGLVLHGELSKNVLDTDYGSLTLGLNVMMFSQKSFSSFAVTLPTPEVGWNVSL